MDGQGASMKWFMGPMRKYADFSGRATRKEYWLFHLSIVLISAAIMVVSLILYVLDAVALGTAAIFLYIALAFGTVIPSLAVAARRLHDTNRSAWWLLIQLVPLGPIVMFVFLVLAGTSGDNDYGPDPQTSSSSSSPIAGSSAPPHPSPQSPVSPPSAPESDIRSSETPSQQASRPVIKMRDPGEHGSSS